MIDQSAELKIIVHAPNWVGDHIMAFPFYAILRQALPNAKLFLIGRSWISSIIPDGFFSKITILDKKKLVSADRESLKAEGFDVAFTLSPSFRSAQLLRSLKSKQVIGYKSDNRSLLLKPKAIIQKIGKINTDIHRSQSYVELINKTFNSNYLASNISLNEVQSDSVEKFYLDLFDTQKSKHFWIICPGSVAPSKIYPSEYLIEIINETLALNPELSFALVGTEIESTYAKEILAQVTDPSRVFDLTTKTSLAELRDLMNHAAGVIANDSGVAHLSALSSAPLISFIGMARERETIMLNARQIVLNKNLACSPCMSKECSRKDVPIECLTLIKPAEVIAAMRQLDKQLRKN